MAVSAALVAAVLAQAPGRLVADTKLDLAVAPVDFLRRAVHLWEPRAAFGHVQNQAAGYLFPMGPFFALGHGLHVPMWIVQRSWVGLLLAVAFVGAVRVADAFDIGTPLTRVAAGLAYALAPSMLAVVGFTSGGQIPTALLPWALLPLVRASASPEHRPARAAARSAAAVFAMGAVNATSTLAVLPLPVLYLLTRARSPRRRALATWWVVAVAGACAWWIGALVLQARYGTDFVTFTETARTTTATTSAFEVLRGSGYWLSYLFRSGPWLPGGWHLVSSPLAIAATGAIAAVGLAGLSRRDTPERLFLVLATVLGLVALTAGFGGSLSGPQAELVRHLLDGSLSPLRNLSKLEPVVRLPLALGFAHALSTVRLPRLARPERWAAAAGVAVVLAGSFPVLSGRLFVTGSFARVPTYWRDAARWVAGHGDGGRSIVVPAASFAEYRWGRPLDEPIEALAQAPWAARDLVPLGSDGSTRLLDAVESRIDTGVGGPELATALERAGVRYLLVRNDLDPFRNVAPSPAYVHAAVSTIAGVRRVAAFGPTIAAAAAADRLGPDIASLRIRVPAVEVYDLAAGGSPVTAYPAAGAVALSGGPEALTEADPAETAGRAVVQAGDPLATAITPSTSVVEDGLRRRDVSFGEIRDAQSYVLTATEPAPGTTRPPEDRLPLPGIAHQSTAQLTGLRRIVASSYGSPFVRLPERQPFAAFDGDAATAWVSGSLGTSNGQWIEADLERTTDVRSVTISSLHDGSMQPRVGAVELWTAAGRWVRTLAPTDAPQLLSFPGGPTTFLRVTLLRTGGAGAGLREIAIPGVAASRPISTPTDAVTTGDVGLSRSRRDPFDATHQDEERSLDRVITLPSAATFEVTGTAVTSPGPVTDGLLAGMEVGDLTASASSVWNDLPAFRAAAAVDSDPSTAWVAGPFDSRPSLHLSWAQPRTLDRITLTTPAGPFLTPTRVRIDTGRDSRQVDLVPDGPTSFPPVVSDQVTITVTDAVESSTARIAGGIVLPRAVAISVLSIGGLEGLSRRVDGAAPVAQPCGSGPAVEVDGVVHRTSVTATASDLLAMRPVAVTACDGTVALGAGTHRISAIGDGPLVVSRLTLRLAGAATEPAPPARHVEIVRWASEHRRLRVDAGAATVLAVHESFNRGWTARSGGHSLAPVRLEGWQQGFVLPAGQATDVTLDYSPGAAYRVVLLVGLLLALAVVLVGWRPTRSPTGGASAIASMAVGSASPILVYVVVVLAVGAIGGPLVLAVPALVLVPPRWWRPAVFVLAALGGATALVAASPGRFPSTHAGAFSWEVQALTVLAIAVLGADVIRRRP